MKTADTDAVFIDVEIVLALSERLARERLQLPANACVRDALAASTFGEARKATNAMTAVGHVADSVVGVWGRRVLLDTQLAHGDRIELYRALIADAKAARLKRASEQGYRWQARTRRVARSSD